MSGPTQPGTPLQVAIRSALDARTVTPLALAPRLKAMGNPRYANSFEVTLHHDLISLPTKWAKPRRIFVNSMSDLFHTEVPTDFIQGVFATMEESERHTFQLLTKRPERALELAGSLTWPTNLWMGVSVENPDYLHRRTS